VPGIAASIGAALAYAIHQVLVRRLRDVASSLDTALRVAVAGGPLAQRGPASST
jgi:drug/metabolite transporter (DMT)-like permease